MGKTLLIRQLFSKISEEIEEIEGLFSFRWNTPLLSSTMEHYKNTKVFVFIFIYYQKEEKDKDKDKDKVK